LKVILKQIIYFGDYMFSRLFVATCLSRLKDQNYNMLKICSIGDKQEGKHCLQKFNSYGNF